MQRIPSRRETELRAGAPQPPSPTSHSAYEGTWSASGTVATVALLTAVFVLMATLVVVGVLATTS
jgi:hypothetical protein